MIQPRWWRRRGGSLSKRTPEDDYEPLTIPGYGPPPVTRSPGGPDPAVYGIPPEIPAARQSKRGRRAPKR